MTPGINVARAAGIAYAVHEYVHDPASESYGLEAAEKLGLPAERVFKTLVASLDGHVLAVAVIPVSSRLNLKRLAKACGVKKAAMAERGAVERATGYVAGGVSPLGQKKRLQTYIDASARGYPTIYVSAGRRGLEIELSPQDLMALTNGRYAELCQ